MRVDIAAYDDGEAVSGPAAWAQRVPQLLKSRGFDVRVLLFNWGCGRNGLISRMLSEQKIRYETVEFSTTSANTSWLLEQIRSDRPEVFVANHVVPALLIGGLLRSCGLPSVGIIRSDDEFYHAVIDNFVGGRQRDQLSAAVGVSEFLTSLADRQTNCMLETICSGTPLPERAASWNGSIKLAYCGRFVQQQKRITETADAIINACKSVPGTTAVMLGDGPELAGIRAAVAARNVAVELPGRVSSENVHDWLIDAQAIVLLSDYEGLPTAVVEGMAAGLVPICTRMRSGIAELVIPGRTGFLVDDRVSGVAAATRCLQNSRYLWEELSGNCRTLIREKFSVDHSADRWANLLHRLRSSASPAAKIPFKLDDPCPYDNRLGAEDRRSATKQQAPQTRWALQMARRVVSRFIRRKNRGF